MPESYAIVIGIDDYRPPLPRLSGAVADAMSMLGWLLTGGGVSPENLALLLSPAPGAGPRLPDRVSSSAALHDEIIRAIDELVGRPGGPRRGDRLFFYYAGHGLTSRIDFADEDAIVAADFSEALTYKSITTRSLLDYFKGSPFRDQFFIFDACRDVPWSAETVLGRMPRPRRHDPSEPAVQQFVFYATSPGQKAVDVRGTLTETLVAGLRGEGRAKAWDARRRRYVVTVDRLFEYLEAEFSAHRRAVGRDSNRELYQVPRRGGERGGLGRDSNPVLASFEEREIAPVPLRVHLDPEAAVTVARLVVRDLGTVHRDGPLTECPEEVVLPPREYALAVSAPSYTPAEDPWIIELFEAADLMLILLPEPGMIEEEPVGGRPLLELDFSPRPTEGVPGLGGLVAISPDLLAPLEMCDRDGRLLRMASGRLDVPDLEPGYYRVRLRSPDGPIIAESLAEVAPGRTAWPAPVRLPGPPGGRLVRTLIEAGIVTDLGGEGLAVPGVPGTLMTDRFSTFLMVADRPLMTDRFSDFLLLAGLSPPAGTGRGPSLPSLGLEPFPGPSPDVAKGGFRALFCDEFHPPDRAHAAVAEIVLRLWPIDRPIPAESFRPVPSANPDFAGLADCQRIEAPGAYWLSVEMPGARPTAFPLTLREGRLSEWIFHLNVSGRINIFHYQPKVPPENASDPTNLRRLEQLQRFSRSGQRDQAGRLAAMVLDAWLSGGLDDPIAACLGVSYLLDADLPEHVDEATRRLIEEFPVLSDAHVLRAAYLAKTGEADRAEEAARRALDVGLPMLARNLARLEGLVADLEPKPGRWALLGRVVELRVAGIPWSAWTPGLPTPGRVLSGVADPLANGGEDSP